MTTPLGLWIAFNVAAMALLIGDLVFFQRQSGTPSLASSVTRTIGWILLAMCFGIWVIVREGSGKGLEFFTGYLIEYALSVDNIFIFVLIFAAFKVPQHLQHRVLFWGVIGAFLMRGLMIGAGTVLLQKFEWLIYLFGAYIVYAGLSMLFPRHDKPIENSWMVRTARFVLPLSSGEHGGRFFLRENDRWKVSMLFLVLIVIEVTDLVFALDSIPAVFGVTTDSFIVYTSNICAVLGLRSLYFVLAQAIQKLAYLHLGLAIVLIFIGGKMLGSRIYAIPTEVSLLVVAAILGTSIIASVLKSKPSPHAHS